MRIVLVHPAGSNWIAGKLDVSTAGSRVVPIGLLSIAAYLDKKGHEVFVHDLLGPEAVKGVENNAKAVLAYSPDLVGFSATTSSFLDAYDIATAIKKADSNIATVCGGVHVSAIGSELMDSYQFFDYLVLGEGEQTLAELASGVQLHSIQGLIWRENGKAVINPPRLLLDDLDSMPFPAYEKLKGFPNGYNMPLFSYVKVPGAAIVTSRGCPYQCSYCDRSVFKKGFRYNSARYVYEHIKYLKTRFGVQHINIYDDLFTANRKRITELCDLLISKPLDINFNCAVRVKQTNDDLLKMLKKAGCLTISLGIESADQEILNKHKSGVSLDDVVDTVRRIKVAGIRTKGLFIMGLPEETEESIQKTSDFIISLDLDEMNMTKFTPFPGAPIWKTIQKEGTFKNDWRLMNCLNFVFIPKGISSKERLDQLYNRHIKRFYTGHQWIRKFNRRIWQNRHSLLHMLKNLPAMLSAKRSFEPDK